MYTYGDAAADSPSGTSIRSIGKGVASGDVGIMPPTRSIEQPIEELTIDGVRMVFQNTPGTEAPAEMNTWFPRLQGVLGRGEHRRQLAQHLHAARAPVRDALAWSKYINEALYRFGDQAEVMFASHSWPRWGKDRIRR